MTTTLIDHVSFAWSRGRAVFDDLSLHLHPGQAVHLTGPPNSGKSTLIALIAGQHRLSSGAIMLDNAPAHSRKAHQHRWYMESAPALCDLLTVQEQLQFYAEAHHQSVQPSLELLSSLGDTDLADTLCSQLSSEQAQKVWFAASLSCHTGGLVLMDEPFSAVEAAAVPTMLARVERFILGGGSVLLTTRAHTHLIPSVWEVLELEPPPAHRRRLTG